jgi:DNA-binding response OmpR family regulator
MQETARSFNIAIVEDEPVLREELAFQLRQFGHAVASFESAGQFYRYLAVNRVAVAILDIGLPDEDGLSICQHLRTHDKQMGIIFATARSQRQDRLQGLEGGADAYLVKPVDLDELILTLNRLRERFDGAAPPQASTSENGNTTGDWQINLATASLSSPTGVKVALTMNELQLLRLLTDRSPKPCTPMELGLAMGMLPDEFDKHRVEVVISRLRTKISRLSGASIPIRSHRGMGYSLSDESRAEDRT